ncbi:MAG: tetratricopeptide repeat protein [Alphaproteobacteria bacterium]
MDASALLDRAVAHHREGRTDAAAALYRLTLAADPDEPNALTMLAAIDRAGGWHAAARAKLERARGSAPARADIHCALGDVCRTLGDNPAALAAYDAAIASAPQLATARMARAELLLAMNEPARAADGLERAAATLPGQPDLLDLLGVASLRAGRFLRAEQVFAHARALAPRRGDLAVKHGAAALENGRFATAAAAFGDAVAAGVADAAVETERALALLGSGRLDEGWAAYGARWRVNGELPPAPLSRRAWAGQACAGKRVLLCAEQGVGDQLIFAAGIPPLLREIGPDGALIVECAAKLAPLFARAWPAAIIEPARNTVADGAAGMVRASYGWISAHEPIDAVAAMSDLPRHRLDRLDGRPYLVADAAKAAHWRRWLDGLGSGPKIGINARSSIDNAQRAGRVPPIEAWRALFETFPDAQFVNLQYDDPRGTCWAPALAGTGATVSAPPGLDQFDDLDGVAALMAGLDLVVAAPTAVACLAGAIGRPTVRLLRGNDWSMLGRTHSPYSRSMDTVQLAREWYGPAAMAPAVAAARNALARP